MIKFFTAIIALGESIKIVNKWINGFIAAYQAYQLKKIGEDYADYLKEHRILSEKLEQAINDDDRIVLHRALNRLQRSKQV